MKLSVSYIHYFCLKPSAVVEPELLQTAIEAFLAECRRPAALEYGENPILLKKGCYALEIRSGRLSIEIWDHARSVSRRILGIERHSTGVLDCTVQKFGGKPGRLTFLDLERPQTAHRTLAGTRQNFAEHFRRMLNRQFPGWEIETLSTAPDLQRSFSPVFPRAKITRGNQVVAAMGCAEAQDEPALLTFALIWHHHVHALRRSETPTPLCLFFPETAGNLTAHRLRWLKDSLQARLFRFNAHGSAGEADPRDLGNLETRVAALVVPSGVSAKLSSVLTELKEIPNVSWITEASGCISVRHRGLEFARVERGRISLGLEKKYEIAESRFEDVTIFAKQLSTLVTAQQSAVSGAPGTTPPHFPERWLEGLLRENLSLLDPLLMPGPVHGQVFTFAGGDRDLIDLLAVSSSGRLAVLELKIAEDIHLPLQALDYWMRAAWHLERGEVQHLFPDSVLSCEAPKLFLIAPAMTFHSSTADILQYFSTHIEVERVGLNSDWRNTLRVVMRLKGAERPISHGGSEWVSTA